MKREWTIIELLRHARHDWLNKVQLIKGNLSLNNIDRVNEIINEIVVEAHQEALLSNLNFPQFATILLTYNWRNLPVYLEFEVLEGENVHGRSIHDQLLANWTDAFLENLNESVDLLEENHLSVTIEPESDGIRFFFDFRGIITDMEKLNDLIHTSKLDILFQQTNENELSLEFFMPYLA